MEEIKGFDMIYRGKGYSVDIDYSTDVEDDTYSDEFGEIKLPSYNVVDKLNITHVEEWVNDEFKVRRDKNLIRALVKHLIIEYAHKIIEIYEEEEES